jgi:COP9 signalosome complex subunit 6
MLQKYVQAVDQGKIPRDAGVLRRVVSLCHQLPTIDTPEFKQEFITEYNDALLITYLASITKSANSVNDLIDKFGVVHEKGKRRGFLS